jgi:general secretion pathway protein J
MSASLAKRRAGEGGFTLIETLVAMALMGLVLSALAGITAQWLPNWNRGLERIQRSELIGIALQRIGADLAAAEYVPANRDARYPLFEGSELSVTFVRTALGPNAGPGLDVVRVGETTDRQGFVTVRSRAPFRPLPLASSLSEQIQFGEPVLLLRTPFRLSFAYAGGPDMEKQLARSDNCRAIKLTVRDAATNESLDFDGGAGSCPVASAGDCAQSDGGCGKPVARTIRKETHKPEVSRQGRRTRDARTRRAAATASGAAS